MCIFYINCSYRTFASFANLNNLSGNLLKYLWLSLLLSLLFLFLSLLPYYIITEMRNPPQPPIKYSSQAMREKYHSQR